MTDDKTLSRRGKLKRSVGLAERSVSEVELQTPTAGPPPNRNGLPDPVPRSSRYILRISWQGSQVSARAMDLLGHVFLGAPA